MKKERLRLREELRQLALPCFKGKVLGGMNSGGGGGMNEACLCGARVSNGLCRSLGSISKYFRLVPHDVWQWQNNDEPPPLESLGWTRRSEGNGVDYP